MKKFFALIMATLMLLTGTFVASAVPEKSTADLQFNKDGKFKIMIFADPQDGYPMEKDLLAFMNESLDQEKPDFVVFLGDNVMSPKGDLLPDGMTKEEAYWLGYDELLEPVVSRGLKWDFVYGNHDWDGERLTIPKESMLEKYQTYAGCLAADPVPELHGVANHNVEIASSDGSRTAFNLWFFDSCEYVRDEQGEKLYYDIIRKDQIAWYEQVSKDLEQQNGAKVPSFAFQHMVPSDVAKQVMVTTPFHLPEGLHHYNQKDGTGISYLPNLFGFWGGLVAEGPSPSEENEGFWDAIAGRGDVLADFFGHDHRNTFKATVKGVDAINVPGCTYHAYRSYLHQGAMVLTLDEKDLSKYDLDMVYVGDMAVKPGSALPSLSRSLKEYKTFNFLRKVVDAIMTVVHAVFYLPGKLLYR